MESLGRTPGNPMLIVAQKWLTGHPEGPTAARQMNGVMQARARGLVPPCVQCAGLRTGGSSCEE
eukprot:4586851-Alexandrium_andersonii.AAC.1